MCDKPLIRCYQDLRSKKSMTVKVFPVRNEDEYEKYEKMNIESERMSLPYKWQRIPCGQCWSCRLTKAKMWSERIIHELETYGNKDSYFITLTYDPNHIPNNTVKVIRDGKYVNEKVNLENGGSLDQRDMQLFIKRLRDYWKHHHNAENIRFFYCGEYGEKGGRAHYHLIIFGLTNLQEYLEYYFTTKDGNVIYRQKMTDPDPEKNYIFDRLWKNGLVTVGSVTYNSANYVARYTLKKTFRKEEGLNEKEYYEKVGKYPEFIRMSRKPGIGREYYEQNKYNIYGTDIEHINDSVIIKRETKKGTKVERIKPAPYYDKLFDVDENMQMEEIKRRRQAKAEMAEKARKASGDTRTYKQYIQDKAKIARQKTSLHRITEREENNWIKQ